MPESDTLKQVETAEKTLETGDFQALLQKEFKPKTDRAQEAVERSVRTLAEYALKEVDLVSANAVATIEAIRAAIDKKLSEQINQILHHPDFQNLEGTWKG